MSSQYTSQQVANDLQMAIDESPSTLLKVQYRNYVIKPLYFSPYPKDYQGPELYICHHCFNYFQTKNGLYLHLLSYHSELECIGVADGEKRKKKVYQRILESFDNGHRTIYHDGTVKLVEVLSRSDKLFCQNLCLFGKLFINHKTLFYDVTRFAFYLLMTTNTKTPEVVGYFSKEIQSPDNCNLSCIIVFPCYQRKGYGQLMIELSYCLSKLEKFKGTPERPLSEMGRYSYVQYWSLVILNHLRQIFKENSKRDIVLSIADLSDTLYFTESDIIEAIRELGFETDETTATVQKKKLNTLLEKYDKALEKYEEVSPDQLFIPLKETEIDFKNSNEIICLPECNIQEGRTRVLRQGVVNIEEHQKEIKNSRIISLRNECIKLSRRKHSR